MSRTVQVKALCLISLIAGDYISASASKLPNTMSVDIDADAGIQQRGMTTTRREQLGNHSSSLASSLAELLQHGETRGKSKSSGWWHNFFHNSRGEASVDFVDVSAQVTDNANTVIGIVATASTEVGSTIPVLGLVLGTVAVTKGVYDIKKLTRAMKRNQTAGKIYGARLKKCQIWNEKKNVFIGVASTATASCAAAAAFSAPLTFGASLAVPAAVAGGSLLLVSVANLIYNKKYSCKQLQAHVLQEMKDLTENTQMMQLEADRSAEMIKTLKDGAKAKNALAVERLQEMRVAAAAHTVGENLVDLALKEGATQQEISIEVMKFFTAQKGVAVDRLAKLLKEPGEAPTLRRTSSMAEVFDKGFVSQWEETSNDCDEHGWCKYDDDGQDHPVHSVLLSEEPTMQLADKTCEQRPVSSGWHAPFHTGFHFRENLHLKTRKGATK